MRAARSGIAVAVAFLSLFASAAAKEASLLVTAEMRARAVENATKYRWAKDLQASAKAAAARWRALSDEELCSLVTSQELPRASSVKAGVFYQKVRPGCPQCGEAILRFGDAWQRSSQQPWKLRCPSCGEAYPKNDFARFYATALDKHGNFCRALGDRSLLFNTEHPQPDDPLHTLYVDDGYGMRDKQGNVYHPVAYCNNGQWSDVVRAVSDLARAYAYTDDVCYAHKAAVLLDRVADVYPAMDYLPLHRLGFQHSQGGSGRGRINGCIAECSVGKALAQAYDWVFDGIVRDPSLRDYDRRKAARYQLPERNDARAICRHIEDHLLLEILRSAKDLRIAGNLGMTHTCAAVAALALDRAEETQHWLDWIFAPSFPGWGGPGGVPWVLVEGLDADGMGGECGGYGLIWSRSFVELAELLAASPRYNRYDMVREFPKLKQCFLVEARLACLDAAMPPIGDSGATGLWGRAGDALRFARGFDLFGDPRLAELAWRYAEGNARRLRQPADLFVRASSTLAERVAAAAKGQAPPPLRCEHLGRYGQAVLQTPQREQGRAVWIHYGYGKGHSHADALNLGLYAHGVDMLPDLGYPAYTGSFPERLAWTSNTISHNTLLVDDTGSRPSPGGKINLLVDAAPLRAIDVSCARAYAKTTVYRRQVAMIDVGNNSYVVDVFRARGGANHRLSWHGPAATAALRGVALTAQARGSYAGVDLAPRQLDGPQGKRYQASGFTYLYDVAHSRGPVAGPWTADWKAEDLRGRIAAGSEPHLRLHGLTPCDELALASGDPPQNKAGNPRRLRYLIQSRLGTDLSSQFVSVLEPYDQRPFIRRVRSLKVEHRGGVDTVAAVAVEFENGNTDVVIWCQEPAQVRVEGGVELDGLLGLVRCSGGSVQSMRMAQASRLKAGAEELRCTVPVYRGRVARIDPQDPQDQRVVLAPPPPAPVKLQRRVIHFQTRLPWDTSYDITGQGADWISTGEITLVRGFRVPTDFRSGYLYAVNPGDEYAIPISAAWDR
jgi:predicted RNA-binding Zn-ribbon protein involved in translation (DUF1610 family)